jgi:type VI secretion system secreted protein Hcp
MFDAFLKIDGIEGESDDRTHKGEIELLSYSWGETQVGDPGGGGGGGVRASLEDFHFTMPMSKASPQLMLACATGRHSQTATLTCRKAGGDKALEFLKIKLSDVLVSEYDTDGDAMGDADLPTDQCSLRFVKIDFLYTAPDGEMVEAVFSQT